MNYEEPIDYSYLDPPEPWDEEPDEEAEFEDALRQHYLEEDMYGY